jgi:hypothetical protein
MRKPLRYQRSIRRRSLAWVVGHRSNLPAAVGIAVVVGSTLVVGRTEAVDRMGLVRHSCLARLRRHGRHSGQRRFAVAEGSQEGLHRVRSMDIILMELPTRTRLRLCLYTRSSWILNIRSWT